MKISYKHLVLNIKENPDINDLSERLFQLGHEHEIENEIFDFEFTPNRGDCLSLRGLLRELNLFYDVAIDNPIYEQDINELKLDFINNVIDFCPKINFLKVEIDEIPNIYSNHLQNYFDDLGIKKNNFFTDISNYISYETGQPTHCYDYLTLKNKLVLDSLNLDTKFQTLLDDEINLSIGEKVFLNDKNEVINFAGIMGGKNTACNKKTKSVLIECAYFNPEYIIGKSIKYDISSDAAYKFERNTDSSSHEYVLKRFLKIIEEHTNILNVEIFENSQSSLTKNIIPFDIDKINKIIGTDINAQYASQYLEKLGFMIQNDKIHVPGHRHDVKSINDISEEIARSIGYNKIEPIEISLESKSNIHKNENELKLVSLLIANGFNEVINDPFVSNDDDFSIEIDNPLDSNKKYLRTSLRNSLLDNLLFNERRQKDIIKLFEISDIYSNNLNLSKRVLGIIASGRVDKNYKDFSKKINKNYLTNILDKYLINSMQYQIETIPRENLNSKLKDPIIFLEIEINSNLKISYEQDLQKNQNIDYKYVPISEYPLSKRDLSFSVKNISSIKTLQEYILNFNHHLLKDVFIFDYFNNQKNNEIKIGFRFIFQDKDKTITEKQVNKIMNVIISYSTSLEGVSIPGLN